MQVLGSRKGLVTTVGAIVLALLAAGAAAGWLFLNRPLVEQVSPAPGSAVATSQPLVAFAAPEGDVAGITVTVDGRDRTAELRGDGERLALRPGTLEEGMHAVEVRVQSGNPVTPSAERRWEFEVSTTPPELTLAQPARGAAIPRRAVAFEGTAEPGARIEVAHDAGMNTATATASADGHWRAIARFPEGEVEATITALDRAGNATTAQRRLLIDTTKPELTLTNPGEGAPITETDEPLIYGRLDNGDPAEVTFGVRVNGRDVIEIRGSAAVTAGEEDELGVVAAAADPGATPLQLDGQHFAIAPGPLAQGNNRVQVWVRDAVGNVARRDLTVVVDSTEAFGTTDMTLGARGADATALQERLKEAGVLSGPVGAVFDRRTQAALSRYQADHGLEVTGRVDAATRESMVGRIVISLSQRKLRLIRGGEVVRTYTVAVGAAGFPTPLGTYEITTMEVDPSWYPPDSPWAEGLGPIPAGPGNPLGTRWIGTSAPAIGIHGTYADASVGTAASHGCIRMHIPEVEALYEEVAVGMQVRFVP